MKTAIDFAKNLGYTGARYVGYWCGYQVYRPIEGTTRKTRVGFPYNILVRGNITRIANDFENESVLTSLCS